MPLAEVFPAFKAVVVMFDDEEALTAIVLPFTAPDGTSMVIQKHFVPFPIEELKAGNV